MALRAAGILPEDPLYRFNEHGYAWVTQENWTYSASFDVHAGSATDSALLEAGRLVLELDGVDTVARVRLNGKVLGQPRSAFVRWRLPVPRDTLRVGSNRLEVALAAPLAYARAQSAASEYEIPLTKYHHVWSEPSHRNFIRKPPSDFGWDWGPAFMPTGITGGVQLHNDGATLEYSVYWETI